MTDIRRWEFKAIEVYVNVDENFGIELGEHVVERKAIWSYLERLGASGWDLVSASAIVGNKSQSMTWREGSTTEGYALWFKRPLPPA